MAPPSFRRERALIKRGVWPVAGCDEAGRGPLAGPVVAAAVVLDPKRIPKGIDNSKRLTAERREELFERDLRDRIVFGRLCLAGADRSRQYSARLAMGARARGAGVCRNAEARLRRWPRQARDGWRMCGRDRRRRADRLDRRSLNHRQGDPRPPDVRAGAGLPRLRFRIPQGLQCAGASGGAGPVRSFGASPTVCLRRSSRRGKNISPGRSSAKPDLFAETQSDTCDFRCPLSRLPRPAARFNTLSLTRRRVGLWVTARAPPRP